MRAISNRSEFAIITLMFVLVTLWSLAFQAQNNVNGYDGMFYVNMGQQLVQGEPVTGPIPWIYRVGTPFLAALLTPITRDLLVSFKWVNVGASLLTTVLLWLYLRRHVDKVYARLVVMFLYLTQWHAPVRFAYFYPTSIDFWLMVFVLAALLLSDEIRGGRTAKTPRTPREDKEREEKTRAELNHRDTESAEKIEVESTREQFVLIGLLSVVIFVGVLFREVVAVFGVTALFIHNPIVFATNPTFIQRLKLPHPLYFLPLVGAAAGVLVSHALVTVNQTGYPYTFDGTVYLWLYDKRLMPYLLAWFVAFGPMLVLVLYNWRRSMAWLAQRQDVVVFVLALVVLAWVGGTDTERFLYWGMPIFYVLLGKALDDHAAWLRKSPLLLGVLFGTQMLSQRFLLPTPDFNTIAQPQIFPLLTVLGADVEFEHLHTFYSTLNWQSLSFALTMQYFVLAAALLVWVSWRAGRYRTSNEQRAMSNE